MAKRLAMTLTDDIHSQLKAHAAEKDRSMSFITRVALTGYLQERGYTINRVHPPQRGGHNAKNGRK